MKEASTRMVLYYLLKPLGNNLYKFSMDMVIGEFLEKFEFKE
jgi:hypothetical protein